MAEKYHKSAKWAQIKLDEVKVESIIKLNQQPLVIVADTTFFSRSSGLIVFRSPHLKKNVWWQGIASEKADIYRFGKEHLEKNGFTIKAVVLDGKKGIRQVFNGLPVQMCHFHQKQIILRYLTSKPKLVASIELKEIVNTLACTNEDTFTERLIEWHDRWKDFLKQKTINSETNRWCYTHKRLRSAHRSLKTNLPYLFTYQRYPELNIPNTTNSLDGYFNRLKGLINVHRGLSQTRRMRIITEILKGKKLPK